MSVCEFVLHFLLLTALSIQGTFAMEASEALRFPSIHLPFGKEKQQLVSNTVSASQHCLACFRRLKLIQRCACTQDIFQFIWLLRAKAATALACLSHRNSVRPSLHHTGGSVKNGAR